MDEFNDLEKIEIGKRVKAFREEIGLAASELEKMSEKFGVSYDWLVEGKGEMFLPGRKPNKKPTYEEIREKARKEREQRRKNRDAEGRRRAEFLRRVRDENGLTRRQIGEMVGRSVSTIKGYEEEEAFIPNEVWRRIVEVFGGEG